MFPPELPPVSNKFLYAWRVFAKLFSYFYFGFNSLILSLTVLPLMRLFLHPKERFQKYGRRFVSFHFRIFVSIMHFIGIVNLIPDNRKAYRQLSSKVIVSNHPSLLDVVMLISLIPNADCIVNGYLQHSILSIIVRQLYIVNLGNLDEILASCSNTLKHGNCLIIFPEGTRTHRYNKSILKKGAARISLSSDCNILPVHIGGTDKYGMGKKDPWGAFNPTERYVYLITMKDEINPADYKYLPSSAAAKCMTDEIGSRLSINKQYKEIT